MPIFELPFTYRITGKAPGRRIATTMWARENAPFEIPSIQEADAPVAMSVVDERGRTDYRIHDGRMYRRIDKGFRGPMGVAEFFEDAVVPQIEYRESRAPRQWYPAHVLPPMSGTPEDHALAVPERASVLKDIGLGSDKVRVVHDGRAERLAQASRDYAETLLILCDGVWSSAHVVEPHYVVAHDPLFHRVGFMVSTVKPMNVIPFRSDQADEALAYAESLARRTGHRLTQGDRIEASDGYVARFDVPKALANSILAHAPTRLEATEIASAWPEDAREAVMLLHQLSSRHHEGLSQEEDALVIGAAGALLKALPNPLPDPWYIARRIVRMTVQILDYWNEFGLQHHPEAELFFDPDAAATDLGSALAP